jgi:hypothetical protein
MLGLPDFTRISAVDPENNSFTIHQPSTGPKSNKTITLTTDWRGKMLRQPLSGLTSGKTYQVKFKVRGNVASDELFVRTVYGGDTGEIANNEDITTDWVEHTYYFTAHADSDDISFGLYHWYLNEGTSGSDVNNDWIEIDDVSIKQTDPGDNWGDNAAPARTWVVEDGKLSHTEGTGDDNQCRQTNVIQAGKKYQVNYSIVDYTSGSVRVDLGDANQGTARNAVGDYSEIITNTGTDTFLDIEPVTGGSGTFKGAISNISVREITNSVKDFSPNTNNGVLYSGKALKFDGADDEIDINTMTLKGEFTVALWYNVDDPHDSDHGLLGDGTTVENLSVQSNTKFRLRMDDGNRGFYAFPDDVTPGTWARIVLTRDSFNIISLYRNNIIGSPLAADGATPVELIQQTYDFTVSNLGKQGSYEFDGAMSDFQVYDKCWTASDVTYDWENPDKDVFDGSSNISPTNCKALYRLNEGAGDRVYNAAPVLGAEMVSNGDFSSIGQELVDKGDFTGITQAESTTGADWVTQAGWTISGGKASVDTTVSKALTQSISVVDGKLYNVSFEISDFVKGKFQVQFGGNVLQSVWDNGVYNYTVSAPTTNDTLHLYAMNESKFSIDNISIKEIESGWSVLEGSHEFLGWAQTGWSIANGKASVDHNNTDLTTMGLSKSSFGQVAGKSYSLSFEISDYVSGNLIPQFSGQALVPGGIEMANGVYNYIVSAGNTNTTFYLYASNSPKFSIDNISVKEIRLSDSYAQTSWVSGNWITAQPYIPQYAMSSYSKKMLFDGSDNSVDCGDNSSIDNIFDGGGSWSAWFSAETDGESSFGNMLSKGNSKRTLRTTSGGGGDITMEFLCSFSGDDGRWSAPTDAVLLNKINHIVVAYNSSSVSNNPKIYINGVSVTVTTVTTPTGSVDAGTGDFTIGAQTSGGGYAYNGFIDEVSVWNKELTVTEVQEVFNAGMALDCRDHSAYLGSEELTNADFSTSGNITNVANASLGWRTGNSDEVGASISGGELILDRPTGGNDDDARVFALTGTNDQILTIGSRYQFTYTVSSVTGSATLKHYTGGEWVACPNSVGTHTVSWLQATSKQFLIKNEVESTTIKLSSVSVKEVDLKGYWRNNGLDDWADLSPYGNDGDVQNAVAADVIQLQEVPYFKKDTFGLPMNRVRERALNLDGDSHVEIADDSSLDFGTGAFSIDGWARFTGGDSRGMIFASGGNPIGAESGSFAIFTKIDGGNRYLQFIVNNAAIDANINSRVADGDWFHFAGTRDTSGDLELYVDSESVGDLSATGNSGATVDTGSVRYIGRDSETTRYYKNLIDDIRLYDRELLAAEVAKNFKATKSKHKNNIVSNWSDDFSSSFI